VDLLPAARGDRETVRVSPRLWVTGGEGGVRGGG
jgi:hypothetical protein